MNTIIFNGKIITPYRVLDNHGIAVKDDKIISIFYGDQYTISPQDIVIDAKKNYISPGFIDIHTHGGGGFDFIDGNIENFSKSVRFHLLHGTTGIVPTSVASDTGETYKFIENFIKLKNTAANNNNLLGVHLEGPYFAQKQKGAQKGECLKNPDRSEYIPIVEKYGKYISIWSIAPELEGSCEMARYLRSKGIVSSIAHSDAHYDEVAVAHENGFNHVTHLYSAMSTIHKKGAYKYAGVVESAFLLDDMTVELIADGVHVPESLIRLAYKIKGSDRICLVTDSINAAGMKDGEYYLGTKENGIKILVEDYVAKLPDRSAFAGSIATTDRLVRTISKIEGIPLYEAVKMISLTPAKLLGIDNIKGSLAAGKNADILIFNDNIDIKFIMLSGEIIHSYKEADFESINI